MRVTIIADASFCPETKAAGYGFWIASSRGKQGGRGRIKTPVVNSSASEMMALVNGLYKAHKWGLVLTGDHILLQTDCIAAIKAFDNQRTRITQEELELVKYLNEFVACVGITVAFRHVKGHTHGAMARAPKHYINNRCDAWAYEQMCIARAKLRKVSK